MSINLKQLETFVWVADLGSFRKAAARLNTTQPNISARIAALESNLGISLMDRDAGSVRLTARGHELLSHARKVLLAVDGFVQAADDTSLVQGVLKLGVTEMIVHTWLGDFLRALKTEFPNIIVELVVDLSVNLEQALAEHSLDLALQSGPFNQQMSGSQALGTYPVIWAASPELDLSGNGKLGPGDLLQHPILTHARNTHPYRQVSEHFAGHPGLQARLVPSSNLAACLQMAVDGFGIAVLLAPMIRHELGTGQLEELDYHWRPAPLSFFARYDKDRAGHLITRAAGLAADISSAFIEREHDQ